MPHREKYWNNIAQYYDSMYKYDTKTGQVKVQRKSAMIKTHGNLNLDSLVLELGCGTGMFTRTIAQSVNKIIGVDLSDNMLNIARNKNTVKNIEYLKQNVYDLPLSWNERFDCIFGTYVLMYLDIDVVLRECKKFLKPNGRIVFIEPNILNPMIWAILSIPIIRIIQRTSDDVHGFTVQQLKKAMIKAEFTNISVEPIEYLRIKLLKEFGGSLIISGEKGN